MLPQKLLLRVFFCCFFEIDDQKKQISVLHEGKTAVFEVTNVFGGLFSINC